MNDIQTERLILKPLSYEELGLLLSEHSEMLGEISLTDLKEGDIPQRPLKNKREKMEALPVD